MWRLPYAPALMLAAHIGAAGQRFHNVPARDLAMRKLVFHLATPRSRTYFSRRMREDSSSGSTKNLQAPLQSDIRSSTLKQLVRRQAGVQRLVGYLSKMACPGLSTCSAVQLQPAQVERQAAGSLRLSVGAMSRPAHGEFEAVPARV